MSYWLNGPVVSGSQVIITHQEGKDVYPLMMYPGASGVQKLILETQPTKTGASLISFNMTGLTQAFFNSQGAGALGYDSNGNAAIAINAAALTPSQTNYAPWGGPFLAGVGYLLVNQVSKTVAFDIGHVDDQGMATVSKQTGVVMVIPSTWYFGCSNGKPGYENDTPDGSLESAICALTPGSEQCKGIQTQGWTLLSDCEAGNVYQYCAINKLCGTMCKGPCASNLDSCDYYQDQGYACDFNPNNLFVGQWWRQPWFILVCFLILGLVLILILVMYFRGIAS